MDINKEIEEVIRKLEHVHYPSGPVYKDICKIQASHNLEKNELAAIYYLKESHAPGLRYKAVNLHFKNSGTVNGLNKDHLDYSCDKSASHENIQAMLAQVRQMPKEWTLVQITEKENPFQYMASNRGKIFTNALHISVFQCGKDHCEPFCVTVSDPVGPSGEKINILSEIDSLLKDSKETSKNPIRPGDSLAKKGLYAEARMQINNRLKKLVKDIQNYWLAEWRCLLSGKLVGEGEEKVEEILQTALAELDQCKVTEKTKRILTCLIRNCNNLKCHEIKKVVNYCFPAKQGTARAVATAIYSSKDKLVPYAKAHPVILILDEKIDVLPWEMVDVLLHHPVSRMPSLHFTYSLYKRYENSIKNGMIVNINIFKGKYVLNPDGDLKDMEKRISNFFLKRMPAWSGSIGIKPDDKEMEENIVENDIFAYFGHGNGTQFFSGDKIPKLEAKAVVFLFGCSSACYLNIGPQVEMYSIHEMYLLACSPCVIGALWMVTDIDTDTLSTTFFDSWLPPSENFNWKKVDKTVWKGTGKVCVNTQQEGSVATENPHEPELLRALNKAKKSASQYITEAAFITRGLPVSL